MKKILSMVVATMVALSFSMIAVAAEEKAVEKAPAVKTEKVEKKDAKKVVKAKKVKKDAKKVEAKPAAKEKKAVSGC